jgi:putative ABC transport system permease protein
MGLFRTLDSLGASAGNLRLVTTTQVDQTGFQNLDGEIQDLLRSTLGEHLDHITWLAESPSMFIWTSRQDESVHFRYYDAIQDRVDYVAGEWPQQANVDPTVIRVVIGDGMARSFGLRVGDRLPLSRAQNSAVPTIWIEVAGIVQAHDPLDPYWFGEYNPLTTQDQLGKYSVIVPGDVFFLTVDRLFPNDKINLAWQVLLKHDSFSAADIEPFKQQLRALQTNLDTHQPRITLQTSVPGVLASFQKQLDSIRLPLYILIAEIVLLGLYFVTMITALSTYQVEREIAILRSRGALSGQIV